MTPVLGLEAGMAAWVLLGGTAVVILVFLVFNPWRTIRDEPPIDEEAETRLLLRQDFETIDDEMSAEQKAAEAAEAAERGDSYWNDEDTDKVSQLDISESDE